jgi:hypothetical protein
MSVRWMVPALIEATKRFHRVRGHEGMTKLVAALKARDEANDVDRQEKAA